MAEWIFRKKSKAEKSRNPMQDEFFASNTEAASLVREAIQNSLDARLDHSQPVKVRFYIGADSKEMNRVGTWFNSASWLHFEANSDSLRNLPLDRNECPYLVYEDFNTKGLNGDIYQSSEIEESKNAFYYFLRAEGQSDKTSDELGSWGVGKIVFPKSSRLRAIFVLTKRSEDKKVYLAGQSILKYHKVNGVDYSPDGWFGSSDLDGFGLPVDDPKIIASFKESFNLTRREETGLSIVMPWPDKEIDFQEITTSVIREYFFSIISNQLEVVIETVDDESMLSRDTIIDEVKRFPDDNNLKELVEMAVSMKTIPEDQIIELPLYDGKKPNWQSIAIDKVKVECIRNRIDSGDVSVIRVPIKIRYKNGDADSMSYFDVVLKKLKSASGRAVYIRDGLDISKVNGPKVSGYLSFVSVTDSPLKNMLGKAENPAHTEWNKGSDHFKGRYPYGGDYINFVRFSVKKIVQMIQQDDEVADTSILSEIFPRAADEKSDISPDKIKRRRGKKVKPPIVPPTNPKPKYFKTTKYKNGIKIQGADELPIPREFKVRLGYDLMKGNPISNWTIDDFDLEDLIVDSEGVQLIKASGNEIIFQAADNNFSLKVIGFDRNRDLKIKSTSKEAVIEQF